MTTVDPSPDTAVAHLRLDGVRVAPVAPDDDADVARVAHLTLCVDRFTLAARRLDRDQVAAWAADPAARVLAVWSCAGSGGGEIVGAAFLRVDPARPAVVHVDDLLLSDRVLGRGVEQAVLSAILTSAVDAGYVAVTGAYTPTADNAEVAGLLPHYGFEREGPGRFRHDLAFPATAPYPLTLRVEPSVVPPLTT